MPAPVVTLIVVCVLGSVGMLAIAAFALISRRRNPPPVRGDDHEPSHPQLQYTQSIKTDRRFTAGI